MVQQMKLESCVVCCFMIIPSYWTKILSKKKKKKLLSTIFRILKSFVFLSIFFSLKVKQIKIRHWQGWIVPSCKQIFYWNFALAGQVFYFSVLSALSEEERVILSMFLPRSFIFSQANWMLLCQKASYFYPKKL